MVVFHDRDLGRMCGLPTKTIADYNYDELPPLKIPVGLQHSQGALDKDSARIPLLRDLLKEFPKYPMQIDCKFGKDSLILATGKMLQDHDRCQETVWGSFHYRTSRRMRALFGEMIPRFLPFYRICWSFLLYKIGFLGLLNIPEKAMIMPDLMVLDRGFISAMQSRGLKVIVFGVRNGGINSFESFQKIHSFGVDGICTDRPSLLKAWIDQRGGW